MKIAAESGGAHAEAFTSMNLYIELHARMTAQHTLGGSPDRVAATRLERGWLYPAKCAASCRNGDWRDDFSSWRLGSCSLARAKLGNTCCRSGAGGASGRRRSAAPLRAGDRSGGFPVPRVERHADHWIHIRLPHAVGIWRLVPELQLVLVVSSRRSPASVRAVRIACPWPFSSKTTVTSRALAGHDRCTSMRRLSRTYSCTDGHQASLKARGRGH
jgi:hypothetical protein